MLLVGCGKCPGRDVTIPRFRVAPRPVLIDGTTLEFWLGAEAVGAAQALKPAHLWTGDLLVGFSRRTLWRDLRPRSHPISPHRTRRTRQLASVATARAAPPSIGSSPGAVAPVRPLRDRDPRTPRRTWGHSDGRNLSPQRSLLFSSPVARAARNKKLPKPTPTPPPFPRTLKNP